MGGRWLEGGSVVSWGDSHPPPLPPPPAGYGVGGGYLGQRCLLPVPPVIVVTRGIGRGGRLEWGGGCNILNIHSLLSHTLYLFP
jgi:hypothetical protein